MAKDHGQSKARPRSAEHSKYKVARTQARKAKNVKKQEALKNYFLQRWNTRERSKRERERSRDIAAFRVARAAKRRAEERAAMQLPPWQAALADLKRSIVNGHARAAA